MQLLRQQQQANEGLQIKDIKQAILIAGFIADTNFIGFVDERLPKTDKSDKTDKLELSHSQVLASLTDVTVELCQCLGEAWLQLLLEQRYTVPQNLVPNLSLTRGQNKITC